MTKNVKDNNCNDNVADDDDDDDDDVIEHLHSALSGWILGYPMYRAGIYVMLNSLRINIFNRLVSYTHSKLTVTIRSFLHSFILDIFIALLQVHYHSEALLTTALILFWS